MYFSTSQFNINELHVCFTYLILYILLTNFFGGGVINHLFFCHFRFGYCWRFKVRCSRPHPVGLNLTSEEEERGGKMKIAMEKRENFVGLITVV